MGSAAAAAAAADGRGVRGGVDFGGRIWFNVPLLAGGSPHATPTSAPSPRIFPVHPATGGPTAGGCPRPELSPSRPILTPVFHRPSPRAFDAAPKVHQAGPPETPIEAVAGTWSVVHLRSAFGAEVAFRLQVEQSPAALSGAHCYVPMRTVVKLVAGARVNVREPLFKSYAFVATPDAGALAEVRNSDACGRGRICAVLPVIDQKRLVRELANLQRALAADASFVGLAQAIREGVRVRVVSGPLLGLEGVVEMSRPSLAQLRVTSMDCAPVLELAPELIEIID